MSLTKTVGSLAHGAVSTAVSAARHPLSTASVAAGLVKGTAEAGVGLVRGVVRGQSPTEAAPTSPEVEEEVEDSSAPETDRAEPEAHGAQPEAAPEGPREPQVVPKPVPTIDELPEPIVIEADDTPGEAFHTEPKVASRDAEHGGAPDDREEIEGYAEELAASDIDIATPVGTTGAEVGHNPDTAESDLQQPQTPPLLDPGTINEVVSESEQLSRAADPDKG
jgi:hypothetical protein